MQREISHAPFLDLPGKFGSFEDGSSEWGVDKCGTKENTLGSSS